MTLTTGYLIALLILFFIIDILHFHFFYPKIVLHAIALDTILAIILTGILLRCLPIFSFNSVLLTNASVIFVLLALLYNVLGPTMCDRSLSVFLLMQVKHADDANKKLTVNELVEITNADYVRGPHMVEKRLIDHEASGAIKVENGVVMLTPSGELAADTFEFLYWSLNIPEKF